MKLGIISDCVHFYLPDGRVATENHILLRQLQALCSHFSDTLICCPFSTYNAAKVYTAYNAANMRFLPVPNVGGNTMGDKLQLLGTFGKWFKAYRQIDRFADVVYQRFPNNLNIPGFFYFYLKKKKVFGTYTGTWAGYAGEPATYRLQRWLLQKHFRGPVWVYTDVPPADGHIHMGFSPSYSVADWNNETLQVQQRIDRMSGQPLEQLKMITVGALIDYKNQLALLKACALLRQQNVPFTLSVVGDGPMRSELEDFVTANRLGDCVVLHGKKDQAALRQLYRQHDFVVQAPLSEGFGKVPIEGFFHGLVPVINDIAMARYITGNGQRGWLFNAANPQNMAAVLAGVLQQQANMPQMIAAGRQFAATQTLEAWAGEYVETVKAYFG